MGTGAEQPIAVVFAGRVSSEAAMRGAHMIRWPRRPPSHLCDGFPVCPWASPFLLSEVPLFPSVMWRDPTGCVILLLPEFPGVFFSPQHG